MSSPSSRSFFQSCMRRLESHASTAEAERSGGPPASQSSLSSSVASWEAPAAQHSQPLRSSSRMRLESTVQDSESAGKLTILFQQAETKNSRLVRVKRVLSAATDQPPLIGSAPRVARGWEHRDRMAQCRSVIEQARYAAARTRSLLQRYPTLAAPGLRERSFFHRSMARP